MPYKNVVTFDRTKLLVTVTANINIILIGMKHACAAMALIKTSVITHLGLTVVIYSSQLSNFKIYFLSALYMYESLEMFLSHLAPTGLCPAFGLGLTFPFFPPCLFFWFSYQAVAQAF